MQILTEKELSEKLGISYWTVRSWRLQLGLPHFRTAGRIFYRWSSVINWMDDQERKISGKADTSDSGILPVAQ
ncbi:helix-turn-helix domain-containing protein [Pectinatus frisingensis]|uniref:helix-turn-helix domain-containing protein n=1 Tax=Pectinatus frisingensis TaxID=865 RepID=UPI0018C6A738|nr:helix-turn-helix domain-containing protein [Pectinatus frisingensis]